MWTMGPPSRLVLSRSGNGLWKPCGDGWRTGAPTSVNGTYVPEADRCSPDMSTNRRSYPHAETAYPQSPAPGTAIHFGPVALASIRVQQLAKRPDIASEVIVLGHLSLDLLAAMQHRRMVAPSKRLAYA
jgi:hypothetical protein